MPSDSEQSQDKKIDFLFNEHMEEFKNVFKNDKALTSMLFDMVNAVLKKKITENN
jgi:hypothetical protein